MTRSTRRSTAGVNHGLLDEDETEDHGQHENEKVSDVDVSQAIENALKICKFGEFVALRALMDRSQYLRTSLLMFHIQAPV